jgi:hypothetical protein
MRGFKYISFIVLGLLIVVLFGYIAPTPRRAPRCSLAKMSRLRLPITTAPPTTSMTASGVIDAYARGSDGALYTTHYSDSAWGAWTLSR